MGISRAQALDCFASDDLIGIGMEADAVRRRLHPDGVVSYAVEREFVLDAPNLLDKVGEAAEIGSTGVTLRCVAPGSLDLSGIEARVSGIKRRYPSIRVSGFSARTIWQLADGKPVAEMLGRLRDAGLDSLAADDFGSSTVEDWLAVYREAHKLGMKTTAAMIFGAGESPEQRLDWMESLRQLQDETDGIAAFVPRSQAYGNPNDEATAVECLKTLAIARMYLDNIEHLQASGTQGLKVLQMGLRFGGNDVGSTGPAATEEELRRVIRDAGFRPVQRDTVYRTMFLN